MYLASATPIWPWSWKKTLQSSSCPSDGAAITANSSSASVTVTGLNPSLAYTYAVWAHGSCGSSAPTTFTEPPVDPAYQGPADNTTSAFYVNTSAVNTSAFVWLTPAQKARAQSLNVIVENDMLEVDYGYCENIHDGRGYTFGRSGFCSGTGDGLQVVQRYLQLKPSGNKLAKYLNPLILINNTAKGTMNASLTGLGGFCKAVRAAAKDPLFRKAQDDLNDRLYYVPSQLTAAHYGINLALTKGELYDSFINEGYYPPGDPQYANSATALIDWTNENLGGAPGDGVDEKLWLTTYLARRWFVLAHQDAVWGGSVGRVYMYQYLINANQWNLNKSISLKSGCCGASGVCKKGASGVTIAGLDYGSFHIN